MLKIFELDLADPMCPVECDDRQQKTRPLYYPLCFNSGGGEVQYTLRDNDGLILFNAPTEDHDYEEYPFPEALPENKVSLVEFTYEQFRALLIKRHGWGETSESDRLSLDKIDSRRLTQIGGEIFPIQGDITGKCENRACSWVEKETRLDVFAAIPPEPLEGIGIWGDDGYGPDIYFCLCRQCGTISCVNRCT